MFKKLRCCPYTYRHWKYYVIYRQSITLQTYRVDEALRRYEAVIFRAVFFVVRTLKSKSLSPEIVKKPSTAVKNIDIFRPRYVTNVIKSVCIDNSNDENVGKLRGFGLDSRPFSAEIEQTFSNSDQWLFGPVISNLVRYDALIASNRYFSWGKKSLLLIAVNPPLHAHR